MIKYFHLIFIVVFLLSSFLYGIDFDDCNTIFNKITTISRDASDITDELDDLKDEIESKKNDLVDEKHDLENCLKYPDIYDLLKDGCNSKNNDYKNALEAYNNSVKESNTKISEFEDLLDGFKRELKKLEYNTGYSF